MNSYHEVPKKSQMEMYDSYNEGPGTVLTRTMNEGGAFTESDMIDKTLEQIIHMKAHAKDLREARHRELSRKGAPTPVTSTITAVFPTVSSVPEDTAVLRNRETVQWAALFDIIVGKQKDDTVTNKCM
jgi:hypothetical protein